MKKYLIIGASSGIGKSMADLLVSQGNRVYGTYNQNPMKNTENLTYHPMDVNSDFELDFIEDELDGMVYCPGSINLRPFKRFKAEDFEKDYQLQVLGAVRVLQKAINPLKKSGQGSVVMFSTVAVQNGFNFHSQVASSKGAVEGLIRSLAAEYAPAIRFNAIAPSLTDTPLASNLLNNDKKRESNAQRHPLKRIGEAKDIAEAASFLLSDKSSWITGQVLHVDGGISSLRG